MDYDYNAIPSLSGHNQTATIATEIFGGDSHDSSLMRFSNLEEVLKTLHPDQSVQCMHPDQLVLAARTFVDHFPGHALYAVKSNPSPYVLQHLYAAGIRHFDVASLSEIKLVRGLFPMAHLAFMHPIKSREAIRTAYFEYGVRDFVIDTFEEMHKILQETKVATDLGIIVRINMPKGSAACPLVGKFGCTPEVAVSLLQDARKVSSRVGISFHVGSQSTDPESYAIAIRKAGEVMRQADIELDVLDVGGGFPIPYLGTKAPALTTYFDVIRDEIVALNLPESCEIWAEPGRALSGLGSTLLVKVELRKPAVEGQTGGDALYINDGSYGNMFEVACMKWSNTVHLVRPARRGRKAASKTLAPFRFFGPTCDSVDYMPGPFMLPEDVCEGDWIAIQGMGAYTAASQSNFNGFCSDLQVEIVSDSTTSSTKRRSRSSSNLTLVKA